MTSDANSAVAQLSDAIDAVLAIDLAALADDEVLDLVREVETQTRRQAEIVHLHTGEVDRRGLAYGHGCASTAVLLSQLLRLSAIEARARVRAADRLAPRQTLTGERLEPRYPVVAAAQSAGEISPRHASLITATIEKVPTAHDVDDTFAEIERFLVDQARQFAPEPLGKIARHLLDVLDPDGTLKDSDHRDRHRYLSIRRRADGSVTGRFDGTAEFGELLLTLLDVKAAPKPAEDGERDQRSVGQRQHDALMDAMRLLLRTGDLSTANGVVATIVLSMTAEQWANDQGLARTGHGSLVPVAEAKRMARGEARIFPVVTDDPDAEPDAEPGPRKTDHLASIFRSVRPIAGYGTCHRIYAEGQRLAMMLRDGAAPSRAARCPRCGARPTTSPLAALATDVRRRRPSRLPTSPPREGPQRLAGGHDRRPAALDRTRVARPVPHPATQPGPRPGRRRLTTVGTKDSRPDVHCRWWR